jgi:hypothetical protein
MTGKVISLDPKEGVINPEFSSLVPKTGSSAGYSLSPPAGQGYTQEEEQIIKARLRDLGYI